MRKSRFKSIDQDGDGNITKDEMSAAKPKDSKGPSVDDIFSKVDTNQDGTIDEAEDKVAFDQMQQQRGVRGTGGPPPDAFKMTEALFKSTDTDSDGQITLQELTSVLKQSEDSCGSSAANQVFEAADTDKDGKITQAELQAFLEKIKPTPPRDDSGGYSRNGGATQTAAGSSFSVTA
jgi:Ca2+-binding EF-hand superfamily protein